MSEADVDTGTPECVELKRKLATAFRIIARRRLDDGIAGHISVRVPGTVDQFWVNPLGLFFEEVTPDDLLRIDHAGEILEGRHPQYNQAGFCIHSAIHRARPDVNAICHTHPPKGTAFAALGVPLKILDQNACSFWNDQALYAEYSGVVKDDAQAAELAAALGEKRVAVLMNHGLITCAASLEQSVIDMLDLERTCELNLWAMKAGEIREVPDDVAATARRVFTSPSRIRLQWAALVRQVERRPAQF